VPDKNWLQLINSTNLERNLFISNTILIEIDNDRHRRFKGLLEWLSTNTPITHTHTHTHTHTGPSKPRYHHVQQYSTHHVRTLMSCHVMVKHSIQQITITSSPSIIIKLSGMPIANKDSDGRTKPNIPGYKVSKLFVSAEYASNNIYMWITFHQCFPCGGTQRHPSTRSHNPSVLHPYQPHHGSVSSVLTALTSFSVLASLVLHRRQHILCQTVICNFWHPGTLTLSCERQSVPGYHKLQMTA